MTTVIRINLLYLQAGPGVTLYRMRVSNTFTVNVIFYILFVFSFVMDNCGAKFQEHCFNISRDIVYSAFYNF